jgi:hypothetical protein
MPGSNRAQRWDFEEPARAQVERVATRRHDIAPFADERDLAWRADHQNTIVTAHQPPARARHERDCRAAVQELSVAGRSEASAHAIEAPEPSACISEPRHAHTKGVLGRKTVALSSSEHPAL